MERSPRFRTLFLCIITAVLLMCACAYAEPIISIQPLHPLPFTHPTVTVEEWCPDSGYELFATGGSISNYDIYFQLYIRDLSYPGGPPYAQVFTPVSGSRVVNIAGPGSYTVHASVYEVNYYGSGASLWDTGTATFNVMPVPEPSSMFAMMCGLSGLALTRRSRRS